MIKNLFYGLLLAFLSLSDAWAGFNHAQWSSGWKVDWDSGNINPTAQWVPAAPSAGNAGFSTASGALTASSTAKYPLPNGNVIDVQAKVIPTGASVGGALLRFAKKSLPLLSTGYAVYDLFQELGMTPTVSSGSLVVTKPSTTTNCLSNIIPNAVDFIAGGQQMLCSGTWITSSGVAMVRVAPDTCSVLATCPDGSQFWGFTWTGTTTPTTAVMTDQEIIDTIANKSGWPSTSHLSRAVADAVASGEPLSASTPTLTGPTSVAGPTSTTTQQQKDPAGNVTGTVTKVSQTTYNITYNNNTITNTSSTVTTTTNPDGSKTVENQDSPPTQDGATDSPLPDVPTLYTKKYPDGLEGVWQQKKDQLKNSPLLQLTNSLMPSIGTGGTCPSFMIPLDVGIRDFGVHDVAPPCYVWDWAKVIVIVSALLLARALIFGG